MIALRGDGLITANCQPADDWSQPDYRAIINTVNAKADWQECET